MLLDDEVHESVALVCVMFETLSTVGAGQGVLHASVVKTGPVTNGENEFAVPAALHTDCTCHS